MSNFPFFIVGCGRSGTTLLRTLLNRHPDVGIPLESLFIIDYLKASEDAEISVLNRMLLEEPEIREWGIDPSPETLEGSESVSESIARLHELYIRPEGKSRWGQKTPRFVRYMDLLIKHFPDARFVHLVRDPRAVANSLIHSDVHWSNAYYAALRWNRDVSMGLDFEIRHPDRVLRVTYEDLVQDAENVMGDVSDFLELERFNFRVDAEQKPGEEYSSFYQNIHANIYRPPSSSHVTKWKQSLNQEAVICVESIAQEQMEELGYLRTTEGAPSSAYVRTQKIERVAGFCKQLYKYLRYRRAYVFGLLERKSKLGLLSDFISEVNF